MSAGGDLAARPTAGDGAGLTAAVTTADLPADLRAAARAAGAPRQVARFLDGMALPAFVAGTAALDAAGVTDGERCGAFTVSGWDPDVHPPDLGGEPTTYEAVARHYITTASPMTWLRKMVNNALCQLALVRGLRGPNNHVVGGPEALAAVLTLGARAVATGVADQVLVVAFDAPAGQESVHEVDGRACAVVLGPIAALGATAPVRRDAGRPAGADGVRHGGRAVDALDALIDAAAPTVAPPPQGNL